QAPEVSHVCLPWWAYGIRLTGPVRTGVLKVARSSRSLFRIKPVFRAPCPVSRVLERLSDAEVNPETPRLLLTVHQQTRDGIQLISEVGADGTDACVVARARADVVPQIVQVEVPGVGPDVAGVDEEHGAEVAMNRHPQLRRHVGERAAADRQTRAAQR